jgi:hypothetical protein
MRLVLGVVLILGFLGVGFWLVGHETFLSQAPDSVTGRQRT